MKIKFFGVWLCGLAHLKWNVGMNRYATFWKDEIIWLEWLMTLLCIKMLYYTFWNQKKTNSTGEEFMKKKKLVNFQQQTLNKKLFS